MARLDDQLERRAAHAGIRCVIPVVALAFSCACGARSVSPPGAPSGATPSDAAVEPAGGDTLQIIVPPDEAGDLPADLWVGCRTGPYFQWSDLAEIVPLSDSEPGLIEAIENFVTSARGRIWPKRSWLILRETDDEALLTHRGAGGMTFMVAQRDGDRWRWAGARGGGACRLHYRVPEGLNQVDWRLDPYKPTPGADGTSLRVILQEVPCTNGEELDDRLLGPQIVLTAQAVRLAFAATPPPGDDFTCPSNPEVPVTVELPEPVGDREIIEGHAVGPTLSDFLP